MAHILALTRLSGPYTIMARITESGNYTDAETEMPLTLTINKINDKDNGILDPTGQATRAVTAQMLKNFMEGH